MNSRLAALAVLLIGAAVPQAAANASGAQDSEQAQSASEQSTQRFFDQFFDQEYSVALKTADQLKRIADNPEWLGVVAAMRAAALLGLKRNGEAEKLFAEGRALSPQNPLISELQYQAGLLTDQPHVAAQALDRMIASFPDRVREFEESGVYWLLNSPDKSNASRNDDRRIALAQLGFGGEANGDYLAGDAIKILLKRGDVHGASDLLRHVDEPQVVEDMLIQQRYAPIWAALEARAGPRLERVRASAVQVAQREYADTPDDNEKLHLLANALRHSGQHDEAIAMRAKLPATAQAMASADEDMGWAVNNVALALHEVGRAEEADQLFAMLNDAPMPAGQGRWRVSMIINRLELLVGDGKFGRALQLLDRTEASAKNDGSPYAQQLVRRLRYCTLASLGRKNDAAKLLGELLKHAKDAPHATVDGLLCAGESRRAEELIIAELDDEEFQANVVRALQPRSLTSDDPSIWAGQWLKLRESPRIAAAYARLGRDMPEAFVVPSPKVLASNQ
jgi:tetratricopeptide (TPR) repeat protein